MAIERRVASRIPPHRVIICPHHSAGADRGLSSRRILVLDLITAIKAAFHPSSPRARSRNGIQDKTKTVAPTANATLFDRSFRGAITRGRTLTRLEIYPMIHDSA